MSTIILNVCLTLFFTGTSSLYIDKFKKQSVSCGSHSAPSCYQCPMGYGRSWCNGECKWSYVEDIFKSTSNLGELPNTVTLKVVVGYDLEFQKCFGGSKETKEAIRTLFG